jgi:hypothetical protein
MAASRDKDPTAATAALADVMATVMERAGRIQEDGLTTERVILVYQEIIRWHGEDDPASRGLLEGMLADE